MEKLVRIVKKGEDDSNLLYWLSLSETERLIELKNIRDEVNKRHYGNRKGLPRVYRIVKRAGSQVSDSRGGSQLIFMGIFDTQKTLTSGYGYSLATLKTSFKPSATSDLDR